MTVETIIAIAICFILLGVTIYTNGKRYKKRRMENLIDDDFYKDLESIGFTTHLDRDSSKYYKGTFKNFQIIFFLDFDCGFFENGFAYIFKIPYEQLDEKRIKELNKKYKTTIADSLTKHKQEMFLYLDYGDFCFGDYFISIDMNRFMKHLTYITDILIKENIQPREVDF